MIKIFRFAADPSLGRLCKWLRILGFDTLYERDLSVERRTAFAKERRCLLTRITALRGIPREGRLLFIHSNNPFEQLEQVIDETDISILDVHLFSRCIRCNCITSPIDKALVLNRIPDYVRETAERFHQCPECGRIYWRGSHALRIHQRVEKLFNNRGTAGGEDSWRGEGD